MLSLCPVVNGHFVFKCFVYLTIYEGYIFYVEILDRVLFNCLLLGSLLVGRSLSLETGFISLSRNHSAQSNGSDSADRRHRRGLVVEARENISHNWMKTAGWPGHLVNKSCLC